jgi:lantibiotic biosynthesis protein
MIHGDAASKQTSIYEPAGFYMLRAPLLSANTFSHLIADVSLDKGELLEGFDAHLGATKEKNYQLVRSLIERPEIARALLVASPDLYETIEHIHRNDTSSRRLERAYAGITRYLVRMSTRSTPFGLFAGVAIGTLSKSTTAQLGAPTMRHFRARSDMEWLLSFIQKIDEDPSLLPHLRVMVNQTVYIAGARTIVPYADIYGKEDHRLIGLRTTPVVIFVMERARQPILYSTLRQEIFEAFPRATKQQVDCLLHQLWESHFLVSCLRPSLACADPAQYILEQLRDIPGTTTLATELAEVIAATTLISQVDARASLPIIYNLMERQKHLISGKDQQRNFYQVDTALRLERPHLNNEIGVAVAEAVEMLLRTGRSAQDLQRLREYYRAFVERYGTEAEVPLLTLLSAEAGLGVPPGYMEPRPTSLAASSLIYERDAVLRELLVQALHDQAMEIELTEPIVRKLTQWDPTDWPPPPPAVEMHLQVHAASREAIDRGKWRGVLAPVGMTYGGRTFGRFFDILSTEDVALLQEYIRREEKLYEDVIFAELSYLPTAGRGANITTHPALRSYEIAINVTPSVLSENTIPLSDLVVGVRKERFYIRSVRLGKEVVVKQSHMLVSLASPAVCRFLLDAAQDRFRSLPLFDWGSANSSPFLPRIVWKRMVLSLAQWHLRPSMIVPTGSGSQDARWFAGLQEWRQHWRVPRYVYLVQADNKLLIDLEHPLSVADLHMQLKKTNENNMLRLQETLPDFEHLWLRDAEDNPYFAELVVPLLLKEEVVAQRMASEPGSRGTMAPISGYSRRIITDAERGQLPGDEWTYLKLYAAYTLHDEIIAGVLRDVVRSMREQMLIDRWFYIRYADPEPHLRVRFHASKAQEQEQVLLRALAWGRELVRRGLIRRVCVDTYDREIERYGGPEAIDIVEKVFTADSHVTSVLISAQYLKDISLDPFAVAIFSLDQFFLSWGLDTEARLRFLQQRTGRYEESEAFRTQRKLLCELLLPWDLSDDPALKEQREKLRNIFAMRESVLKSSAAELQMLDEHGKLWQTGGYILGSFAHMHINRLSGVKKEQEQKIYALWRHTLESIMRRPSRDSKKIFSADI